MKPEDCHRYESCNCNICPMDELWRQRNHLRGEPVCYWLREWSKSGGESRVRERLLSEQGEAIRVVFQAITEAQCACNMGLGEIRRVLRDSAKTGSKLEAGKKLQALWRTRRGV